MSILKLDNISYSYDSKTKVLDSLSYEFEKGKIYCITGKSGAGKSTLLSLLSGLTSPDSGTITVDSEDIGKIDKYKFRSQKVGVIFQGFNLLPQLTAQENVILSMDVSGKNIDNKKKLSLEILNKVQIDEDKAQRRVLKLSGGEQQRVAIARALAYDPGILLADEPTGNLDIDTQHEVLSIFKKLAYDEDKCVIIVTHSPDVAALADEIYKLAPLTKAK